MRTKGKTHTWVYDFLGSRGLTIILFFALCVFLAAAGLSEEKDSALWQLVRLLLALFAVNLLFCTVRRIKTLPLAVFIIHFGIFVTLIGAGISSLGYVATVNIYEGSTASKVYRWDLKKEVDLGADLTVERLYEEYYPVPVRIGVLRGEEKAGLFELRTGENFNLDDYRVRADELDAFSQNLKLSVFNDDEYIGSAETATGGGLSTDFPYTFVLVAYMDPVLKKTWADLRISKGSETLAQGSAKINSPLKWKDLNFYHTETNMDERGNAYVGIQITKDPGVPYVYAGFFIISLGGVLYLRKKLIKRVRP